MKPVMVGHSGLRIQSAIFSITPPTASQFFGTSLPYFGWNCLT